MIYQLPSGKCIDISVEYFLSLTDEQIMEFVSHDLGLVTENPWNIKLKSRTANIVEEDFDDDKFVSLDKYSMEEKINDADYMNLDDI